MNNDEYKMAQTAKYNAEHDMLHVMYQSSDCW